jgi:hypothetical protein
VTHLFPVMRGAETIDQHAAIVWAVDRQARRAQLVAQFPECESDQPETFMAFLFGVDVKKRKSDGQERFSRGFFNFRFLLLFVQATSQPTRKRRGERVRESSRERESAHTQRIYIHTRESFIPTKEMTDTNVAVMRQGKAFRSRLNRFYAIWKDNRANAWHSADAVTVACGKATELLTYKVRTLKWTSRAGWAGPSKRPGSLSLSLSLSVSLSVSL